MFSTATVVEARRFCPSLRASSPAESVCSALAADNFLKLARRKQSNPASPRQGALLHTDNSSDLELGEKFWPILNETFNQLYEVVEPTCEIADACPKKMP